MATGQHRGGNAEPSVFRTRLHPMTLAGGAFGTLVTLLGVWMIVLHNDLGRAGVVQTVLYGGLVACLWLVGPALRFLGFEVVVRGDEVVVTTQPFGGARSARIGDIENVVEHAGSLGRQLGYGTVVIYGRQGTGATLRHVRGSEDLRRALVDRAARVARRPS